MECCTRTDCSRDTPPTAFENTILDTTPLSSPASQGEIKQIHEQFVQRIFEELAERVYTMQKGFYERYFEGMSWMNNVKEICDELGSRETNNRWRGWSKLSIQNPIFCSSTELDPVHIARNTTYQRTKCREARRLILSLTSFSQQLKRYHPMASTISLMCSLLGNTRESC